MIAIMFLLTVIDLPTVWTVLILAMPFVLLIGAIRWATNLTGEDE